MPQPISGRVLPYEIGRIPADNRNTLEVRFAAAFEVNQFDRAPLEKLYNAGVPSDRFIVSALQPVLCVANVNLLRNICGCIEQNWQIYDNSALYAKLSYWALVRDSYSFINVVPVAVPFPVGFDPVWLNLDVDEPVANDYLNAIAKKSIVLVSEVDFDSDDLQVVYWLAKSGSRIDGPDVADAHVFHSSYLDWPGINITILAHGPAPPPPPAQLVSSDRILTFLNKLASRRSGIHTSVGYTLPLMPLALGM